MMSSSGTGHRFLWPVFPWPRNNADDRRPSSAPRPRRRLSLWIPLFTLTLMLSAPSVAQENLIHSVRDLGRSRAFYSALGLKTLGAQTFEVPGEAFGVELRKSTNGKREPVL